ncbi:signal recognition particle protein [Magnetospirillum sp. 64-120]|uniref:signal recognition particle protein n=1 Tax=Magnetospirillum sp. 64-120 TaxID=1895778 RepID=UPI00092AA83D|nr:signal recognition particle protein [Magnetospirillum sp. 64-120]OJX70273.1 MAG: signal recognition particle protein [Magnetospirillum sp. 64-120]
MFESLSQRLSGVFDKLTGRGALSEADVTEALREVRVALLEADVALPVVKDFVGRVKARAIGQDVVKSVTPGQMVVKIVHDELIATLGGQGSELNLNAVPPAVILMVGLQGSGKTTTSGKLAVRLKKDKKKVLLASLDVYRPAAQQQLEILAKQAEVGSLPIIMGEMPVAITKRALEMGRKEGYDVVVLDTAGRLHIDEELMAEVAQVRDVAKPVETLLVVDSMIGQDAVTLAKEFNEKVGVTGMVLTRVDGDARGGAALSMRAVTGKPIKFLGLGEKLEALEPFHPDRLAGRILGMGDVVSLVEKAMETIEQEEAEKLAKRIEKGKFDLNDMLAQFKQVEKMGDLKGIIGMLPGLGKMAGQLKDAQIDNKMVGRQKAVIQSMTPSERKNPDLIKASRKKRIAAGAGVSVQDVNKLLKQYQQMADVMKKVGKMGQKGLMRHGLGGLLPPGMRGFGR